MTTARSWRARLLAIGTALLVAFALLVPVVRETSGAQAQGAPYSVTIDPTSGITDGKRITITTRTSADHPVYSVEARVCRSGVEYQPSDGPLPSDDFRGGGANCPPTGLSTAATPELIVNPVVNAATPEGEVNYMRLGVGVAAWTTFEGTNQTLACDARNPCSLVVQIRTGAAGVSPTWVPFVFELGFAEVDPTSACGGASAGALRAGGSDALSDAWVNWTLASCNTQGTAGAWTNMAFGDEIVNLERLGAGELDLAYSGVGFSPEGGFVGADKLGRETVAVPVGIGAASIGLGNGYIDNTNRKRPYGPVSLSLTEAAGMVGGGAYGVAPFENDVKFRNPELNLPGLFTQTAMNVGGPSEGGTTPWVISRHFDTLRPDQWKVPSEPLFGPAAGQGRDVDTSFALADPSYNFALTLLTGRPALARELARLGNDGGGVWMVTDQATVKAFDLQPVAIENAAGAFVEPNSETMTAAVADMAPNDQGIRLPNPTSTAGYPLTYVVYAIVPAQPLTDETGACRTDSQELMAKWLTYLVGEGQSALPAGLEPLTAELRAEADVQLGKVGQTPGQPCPVPPIGTPPPNVAPPAGLTAATGAPTGAANRVSPPSGRAAALASANDAVEQANAELTVSDSDSPGFFGGALPSLLAALAALLGIGGLTAVAARQTGRRALPELERLPDPPDHPEPPQPGLAT